LRWLDRSDRLASNHAGNVAVLTFSAAGSETTHVYRALKSSFGDQDSAEGQYREEIDHDGQG
jgi:hypothetical protein